MLLAFSVTPDDLANSIMSLLGAAGALLAVVVNGAAALRRRRAEKEELWPRF